MRSFFPVLILMIFQSFQSYSQHTFSIVAVDSISGEIGSAGATCLSSEDGAIDISEIVLNVGAINTQAWWTTVNQNAAGVRMEAGDSPQEIIDWLVLNDNSSQGGNINDRQYGIVDLNDGHPRSAAYTGMNNFDEKGQRIGKNYSIQGNILISQDVLDDMEFAFLNTSGPLCEKLMATMQAAKRPGADSRCLTENISSASAFIRVAKPTDTDSSYGNLWLDINVWLDSGTFTGDPIDELQNKFEVFKNSISAIQNIDSENIKVYPNPTNGIINIESTFTNNSQFQIYNSIGFLVRTGNISNTKEPIDISDLPDGVYFLKIVNDDVNKAIQKQITLLQSAK